MSLDGLFATGPAEAVGPLRCACRIGFIPDYQGVPEAAVGPKRRRPAEWENFTTFGLRPDRPTWPLTGERAAASTGGSPHPIQKPCM